MTLATAGVVIAVGNALSTADTTFWTAESSDEARAEGFFVASPVIVPSVVAIADSAELRVVDAWVQRTKRPEVKWIFLKRWIVDSTNYLIVNLGQVGRDSSGWSDRMARCFADYDVRLEGHPAARSTTGALRTAYTSSVTAFPDTIHLEIARRPRTPYKAGTVDTKQWCPGA